MKNESDIIEFFGIEPEPLQTVEMPRLKLEKPPPSSPSEDIESAKINLKALINDGEETLCYSKIAALENRHPMAFKSYATILQSLVQANKALVDICETGENIRKPINEGPTTVNNNLFLSTAEMMELLKKSQMAIPPPKKVE
jgi:hypothetical protein